MAKKSDDRAGAMDRMMESLGKLGISGDVLNLDMASINAPRAAISTGIVQFDYLIGGPFVTDQGDNICPGVPLGAITNVYGSEHSGKTSFCLHTAAEAIRQGKPVLYVDYEHILDPRYARKLGVPVDDKAMFRIIQPSTLEAGVAAMIVAIDSGVKLIVFDSVGAAEPKEQAEQSMEAVMGGSTGSLGSQARAWSRLLPKIQNYLNTRDAALIAVSQTRSGINSREASVMGGRAWKFYSAVRISLKYIGKIQEARVDLLTGKRDTKAKIGNRVRITIKKNKVAPTLHAQADLDCIPNKGFDPLRNAINVAVARGVIKRGGAWYTWVRDDGEEVRGQGMGNFYDEMIAVPDVVQQLHRNLYPVLSMDENSQDFADLAEVLSEDGVSVGDFNLTNMVD